MNATANRYTVTDIFGAIFQQIAIDAGYISSTNAKKLGIKSTGQRVYAGFRSKMYPSAISKYARAAAECLLETWVEPPSAPAWISDPTNYGITMGIMNKWSRGWKSKDETIIGLMDYGGALPPALMVVALTIVPRLPKNLQAQIFKKTHQMMTGKKPAPPPAQITHPPIVTNPCAEIPVGNPTMTALQPEEVSPEIRHFVKVVDCKTLNNSRNAVYRIDFEDRDGNKAFVILDGSHDIFAGDYLHIGDCVVLTAAVVKYETGEYRFKKVRFLENKTTGLCLDHLLATVEDDIWGKRSVSVAGKGTGIPSDPWGSW